MRDDPGTGITPLRLRSKAAQQRDEICSLIKADLGFAWWKIVTILTVMEGVGKRHLWIGQESLNQRFALEWSGSETIEYFLSHDMGGLVSA